MTVISSDLKVAKRTAYFIDLFCGAGGVSTGISMAKRADGSRPAKVIACVNHDQKAILSHGANHPKVKHFTEDIRTLNIEPIIDLVERVRTTDPWAEIHLWASLECTNFSKAKGGLPRDGDSRTLANHLFRYVEGINPDHIWIENVREFMAWGPLNENGKPLSRKNGRDYIRWVNKMKAIGGYKYDWKLLCCADYGDYTSRTRFFAQFSRTTIKWPQRTHSKKPKNKGMFPALKPWKAVREVLDLEDHGKSIFDRKKPLVENTLKRIYAGLVKFVGNGEEDFLMQYYSGRPEGKVHSLDRSCPTVTTIPGETIVKPVFIAAAYGGATEQRVHDISNPSPTITVQQRLQAVLVQYNGGAEGNNIHSVDKPAITLTTKDRLGIVQFMPMQYGQDGNVASVDEPAWSVTTTPKHVLATSYLVNPQYQSKGRSINDPCFTLIARMDKMPPYLATTEDAEALGYILIYPDDSETMVKIKKFMAAYGIADIKMRMLNVGELKRITGLPTGYVLYGTKGEQKKFIGNAVPTYVVKAMIEAYN